MNDLGGAAQVCSVAARVGDEPRHEDPEQRASRERERDPEATLEQPSCGRHEGRDRDPSWRVERSEHVVLSMYRLRLRFGGGGSAHLSACPDEG